MTGSGYLWPRLVIGVLVALMAACERPFVEERPPAIEVIEPDLSVVQTAERLRLRLRATSFRPVDRVSVDGVAMTFIPDEAVWEADVALARGHNALVVEAVDVNGVRGVDTLHAVRLPYHLPGGAPVLEAPRAGHTVTRLSDGSLLLAGGVAAADGPALGTAFLLAPGGTRFERLPDSLHGPRAGHTATRLPDGSVLFLGGSRRLDVPGLDALVETAERFDPATRTFTRIPVEGEPIRRAFHTAVLRLEDGLPIVDLYGGRGDVQYRPAPRLGIRNDLRSFALVRDTLRALSPAPGPFIAPLTGHTQTPVDQADETRARRFLVLGAFFDGAFADVTSLFFDYDPTLGLFIDPAPPPLLPRTRHAAVHLRPGFVLVLGGRQGTGLPSDADVYVEPARRFFRLPAADPEAFRRSSLTATFLGDGRILLTGGQGPDGSVQARTDLLTLDF